MVLHLIIWPLREPSLGKRLEITPEMELDIKPESDEDLEVVEFEEKLEDCIEEDPEEDEPEEDDEPEDPELEPELDPEPDDPDPEPDPVDPITPKASNLNVDPDDPGNPTPIPGTAIVEPDCPIKLARLAKFKLDPPFPLVTVVTVVVVCPEDPEPPLPPRLEGGKTNGMFTGRPAIPDWSPEIVVVDASPMDPPITLRRRCWRRRSCWSQSSSCFPLEL